VVLFLGLTQVVTESLLVAILISGTIFFFAALFAALFIIRDMNTLTGAGIAGVFGALQVVITILVGRLADAIGTLAAGHTLVVRPECIRTTRAVLRREGLALTVNALVNFA